MNNQQSIDHTITLINAEIEQSKNKPSGYMLKILGAQLEAHQNMQRLLSSDINMQEAKFNHQGLPVMVISPRVFHQIYLAGTALESNFNTRIDADIMHDADCYIFNNSLGMRFSNRNNDYASYPTCGLPMQEICENIERVYNTIMEELADEIREKAQGFC